MALALSIEAAELNELFLWKKDDESESVDREKLKDELAGVFAYAIMLAGKHDLGRGGYCTSQDGEKPPQVPRRKSKGLFGKICRPMIVYKNSKQGFLQGVDTGGIGEIIREEVQLKLGKRVGQSEFRSWVNSLEYMESVLHPAGVPEDAGVAIEYSIPRTSKRIDFLVSGRDEEGEDNIVLIELKQWSEAEITSEDAIVEPALVEGCIRPFIHPIKYGVTQPC